MHVVREKPKIGNILAVQPYGYILGDGDMGSGAIGSRARILWAEMNVGAGWIRKKEERGENLIAVFPQDLKPEISPLDPSFGLTLGEMMGKYLRACPEMAGVEVVSKPLGHGTKNDILNTYEMVKGLGYELAHISFVSDPAHIKRVKIIWDRTHPFRWTAEFFGAPFHRMTWWERWAREPIARLVTRIHFLLHKHQRYMPVLEEEEGEE